MNLLLDTHIFLWWFADDKALHHKHREMIANPGNSIWISAATAWEIMIKKALGKLKAPNDLGYTIQASGFFELPLMVKHTETLLTLPPLHRDPFDRILIAQAIQERFTILTLDRRFEAYPVSVI